MAGGKKFRVIAQHSFRNSCSRIYGLVRTARNNVCAKVSALQESPEANYMLGRIVPAGADAYSRLHMKGALNLPT